MERSLVAWGPEAINREAQWEDEEVCVSARSVLPHSSEGFGSLQTKSEESSKKLRDQMGKEEWY